MNREDLSEDGVLWWPSDSNNYNGDREAMSSPRPLWSLCLSSSFLLIHFAYFKACTRGTMYERVINNQEFLSCFFLPPKSDS